MSVSRALLFGDIASKLFIRDIILYTFRGLPVLTPETYVIIAFSEPSDVTYIIFTGFKDISR